MLTIERRERNGAVSWWAVCGKDHDGSHELTWLVQKPGAAPRSCDGMFRCDGCGALYEFEAVRAVINASVRDRADTDKVVLGSRSL